MSVNRLSEFRKLSDELNKAGKNSIDSTELQSTSSAGMATASDPCVFEQLVKPWDLTCSPTQRGDFGYRICYLKTPSVTIYLERFGLGCRLLGFSPAEIFGFAVPIQFSSDTEYWRAPLQESGLPAMLTGGLQTIVTPGQQQVVVLVHQELLHEYLPAETVEQLRKAAKTHLLPALDIDMNRLGKWLTDLIEEFNRNPQMLRHDSVVHAIELELLRRLAHVVQIPVSTKRVPGASKRLRGFERGLEYIRTSTRSHISLTQLVEASGVSERTLDYAFKDILGLSPARFLRRRRIHVVRRELTKAFPGSTTIANIAFESGFYHLGRFSARYKEHFHELPSETLQRIPCEEGPNLHSVL